jgi:hypothetical protein
MVREHVTLYAYGFGVLTEEDLDVSALRALVEFL